MQGAKHFIDLTCVKPHRGFSLGNCAPKFGLYAENLEHHF